MLTSFEKLEDPELQEKERVVYCFAICGLLLPRAEAAVN